jgi:O-antigen biosynthesis protein
VISIFTPTHEPSRLGDLYDCLTEQTEQNWEWIIVPNNGAEPPQFDDSRVKVHPFLSKPNGIGELKRYACSKASGEVLVEVDHDDLIVPTCLERVSLAFADPEVCMAYSDWAEVDEEFKPRQYGAGYGWEYYPFTYRGHELLACRSPVVHPANFSKIYYAPNHVRAWRRTSYLAMGGHNRRLAVADDHDLAIRSYLFGKVARIPECLYIYRVHGENSWLQNVDKIRDIMMANYVRYLMPMAEKWADDQGLTKLDLCGGINPRDGYVSIDLHGGHVTADLNETWPVEDNSVGVVWANDAVEHLIDPVHTMNEAYRVLAHGGLLVVNVPSTDGAGAWCDPTHRSYWNARSFRYYTEPAMRRFIEPVCRCRFQALRVVNGRLHDGLPYVFAHLLAVKDGDRIHGPSHWA